MERESEGGMKRATYILNVSWAFSLILVVSSIFFVVMVIHGSRLIPTCALFSCSPSHFQHCARCVLSSDLYFYNMKDFE